MAALDRGFRPPTLSLTLGLFLALNHSKAFKQGPCLLDPFPIQRPAARLIRLSETVPDPFKKPSQQVPQGGRQLL
ncbi:MAG: hypothetical protein ABEJ96_09505, partial [Thiohalorhabdaceae bacterium]